MAKGNYTKGPGSRAGRPKGTKRTRFTEPLVTRISPEATERLESAKRLTKRPVCALVSDALIDFKPMKPETVSRKIKKKLKNIGIDVVRGSSADEAVRRAGRIGAEAINTGNEVSSKVSRKFSESVESLKKRIHDATRPDDNAKP